MSPSMTEKQLSKNNSSRTASMAPIAAGRRVTVVFTPSSGFYDKYPIRTVTLASDNPIINIGRTSKSPGKNLNEGPDNAWFDCAVISRNHAELFFDQNNNELYLHDKDSRHGTFINNVRMHSFENYYLKTTDSVRFGAAVVREKDVIEPREYNITFSIEATVHEPTSSQTSTSPIFRGFRVPDDDDDDDSGTENADEFEFSPSVSVKEEPVNGAGDAVPQLPSQTSGEKPAATTSSSGTTDAVDNHDDLEDFANSEHDFKLPLDAFSDSDSEITIKKEDDKVRKVKREYRSRSAESDLPDLPYSNREKENSYAESERRNYQLSLGLDEEESSSDEDDISRGHSDGLFGSSKSSKTQGTQRVVDKAHEARRPDSFVAPAPPTTTPYIPPTSQPVPTTQPHNQETRYNGYNNAYRGSDDTYLTEPATVRFANPVNVTTTATQTSGFGVRVATLGPSDVTGPATYSTSTATAPAFYTRPTYQFRTNFHTPPTCRRWFGQYQDGPFSVVPLIRQSSQRFHDRLEAIRSNRVSNGPSSLARQGLYPYNPRANVSSVNFQGGYDVQNTAVNHPVQTTVTTPLANTYNQPAATVPRPISRVSINDIVDAPVTSTSQSTVSGRKRKADDISDARETGFAVPASNSRQNRTSPRANTQHAVRRNVRSPVTAANEATAVVPNGPTDDAAPYPEGRRFKRLRTAAFAVGWMAVGGISTIATLNCLPEGFFLPNDM